VRNEEARSAWREAVAQLDPEQLVFVDESGTHISLTRVYGWAPHDQRATGSVPRNHGKNTTLVAALAPDGLHEPWLIEGAMETATFAWYVAEQLAPTLRPGQVVVMDHLSAHKADRIRQAIAARGCQLLFLPPYSPDCTPIEQAFSKIKALLRGLGARSKEALQGSAPRKRSKKRFVSPLRRLPATMPWRGSPTLATLCLLRLPESCSREPDHLSQTSVLASM